MTPRRSTCCWSTRIVATMRAAAAPYGAIRDGAVGMRGGAIAWVGRARDLPRDVDGAADAAPAAAAG